ncbi:electron transport complex subunit RsxA [Candidatus Methylocalor cossyra]|uniref:Ion-translocating oxidoreductase complex subunit A n=1 Tax=Candidatus Methylocalor cossyra TaxID=3108543 RepID=A0ABM9NFZ6_9GAMM
MKDYLLTVLGASLVNNVLLVNLLGLCPLLGVSRNQDTALAMGLATTFVLTLATIGGYLLDRYLLVPLGLEYLRALVAIVVIAAVVQFTELALRHIHPLLQRVLGLFLPLITSNCAVLGVILLNAQKQRDFLEALMHGLGTALGFTLVLVLFAGLRERVEAADVPAPFRGQAIALITAGLAALAFLGFSGLAGA